MASVNTLSKQRSFIRLYIWPESRGMAKALSANERLKQFPVEEMDMAEALSANERLELFKRINERTTSGSQS